MHGHRAATIIRTAFVLTGIALATALILALETIWGLSLPIPIREGWLLTLYFYLLVGIPLALASILLLGLVGLGLAAAGSRAVWERAGRWTCAAALGVAVGGQVALLWIEWHRPIALSSRGSLATLVAVSGVAAVLGGLWGRRWAPRGAGLAAGWMDHARRGSALLLIFLILPGPLLLLGHGLPPVRAEVARGATGPAPAKSQRRVLIVGWDGATLDILLPLVRQGRLPTVARLLEEGTIGPCSSITSVLNPFAETSSGGMRSAMVWTCIATGKGPTETGIHDFQYLQVAGLDTPFPGRFPLWDFEKPLVYAFGVHPVRAHYVDRRDRRARALWNIASEEGLSVGVIGWWLTWPAEEVRGYMVSDEALSVRPGRIYPDSLERTLPHRQDLREEVEAVATRLTPVPFDPEYAAKFERADPRYRRHEALATLRGDLLSDLFTASAAGTLIRRWPTDLTMVYFLGPDNVEHLFWKYQDPVSFPEVSAQDRALYGDVIERYYVLLDSLLATILEAYDSPPVVLLCSDHGMGPWHPERASWVSRFSEERHPTNSGNHRVEGLLLLSGDEVVSSAALERSSVLDLAPTVLYLLGLRVAQDMDGRVIQEVLDPDLLARTPILSVPTYEGVTGETVVLEREKDGQTAERLRALGYVQ